MEQEAEYCCKIECREAKSIELWLLTMCKLIWLKQLSELRFSKIRSESYL